jgi:hypothetical protein
MRLFQNASVGKRGNVAGGKQDGTLIFDVMP